MHPERISPLAEYEFSMLVAAAAEGFNATDKRWFANDRAWKWLVGNSDLALHLKLAGKEPGREFGKDFYRSFASAMRGHGFHTTSRAFIGGQNCVTIWRTRNIFLHHMAERPRPDRGANRYTADRSMAHFDRLHEWRPWE